MCIWSALYSLRVFKDVCFNILTFLWLTGKGDRTGTNIAKAYKYILESMKIEQETNKEDFMQTQHIVIMFTDGIDDNIYS